METKVKSFQAAHDLKVDGMVGLNTYRRLLLFRETYEEYRSDTGVLINGKKREFKWPKFKLNLVKPGCYRKARGTRKLKMIVTHWDVCTSAESCKRVLEKRNISTHFVIDNDGTIVQLVDPQDVAWHAGIRKVNKASVGIDFSNAVYTKYNKAYAKKGFGLRPVIDGWRVHGWRPKPFLGAYPIQIEAYKALLEALHKHYGIPMECPLDDDGNLLTGIHKPSKRAKFKGVVNHYNLSKKKWDTLGLELDKILEEIRG